MLLRYLNGIEKKLMQEHIMKEICGQKKGMFKQEGTMRNGTPGKNKDDKGVRISKDGSENDNVVARASHDKDNINELYDARTLRDANVQLHVPDTEEILDEADKNRLKMKEFQKDEKEFPEDVKVMMNVFESMESELDELNQNELLNDRLLEAILAEDTRKSVL
ncbi:hypothetical protein Tco_0945767 [Tanacetum coccineum]